MSPQDEILNIRIDAEMKSALQAAAEREGRSVGNLVKQLIKQYCVGTPQFFGVQSPVTPYRIAKKKKSRIK